jgi:hypothetical protein
MRISMTDARLRHIDHLRLGNDCSAQYLRDMFEFARDIPKSVSVAARSS